MDVAINNMTMEVITDASTSISGTSRHFTSR